MLCFTYAEIIVSVYVMLVLTRRQSRKSSAEYRLVCYVCGSQGNDDTIVFSASASSPHPSFSPSLLVVLSEETGAVDRTSSWTREPKCFFRSSVWLLDEAARANFVRDQRHILYMHHALIHTCITRSRHTYRLWLVYLYHCRKILDVKISIHRKK